MAILVEGDFTVTGVLNGKVIEGSISDKAIVAYQRGASSYNFYVRIVTSISAQTVGSALLYGTTGGAGGHSRYDIARFNATYALATWSNANGGVLLQYDLWDISGSTVIEVVDDSDFNLGAATQAYHAICVESETVGYAVYYSASSASARLSKFTRSGASFSSVTSNDITANNSLFGIDALEVSKVIIIYYNGSNYPTVSAIDTSSGVSQGSAVVLESAVYTTALDIVALSPSTAVAMFEDGSGQIKVCAMTVSGTTVTAGTPLQVVASGGATRQAPGVLVKVNGATCKLCLDDGSNDVIKTFSVSSTTISEDSTTTVDGNGNLAVFSDGSTQLVYVNDSDNDLYLQSIANFATFYQGAGPGEGVLSEKFTLPFSGVAPNAMTLNGTLGTVVLGANAPSGQMIVYADSPYAAGTVTDTGFPTGAAITALKWI